MRIHATAPAKLLLVGEYAVVEGAPALVAAVDRRVEVEVREGAEDGWAYCTDAEGGVCRTLRLREGRLLGEDGRPAEEDAATRLLAVAVASSFGPSTPHLPANLDVAIGSRALHDDGSGHKLGLGSSAAVMVAVGHALRRLAARVGGPEEPTRDEALRLDLAAHRHLQRGRGSGADVAASVHGGIVRFRRGEGDSLRCRSVSLPDGLFLRCFWTGRSASTSAFLAKAEAARRERPAAWEARMQGLSAVAAATCDAFENANTNAFLEGADAYAEGLRALGETIRAPILSKPHAALRALATRCGAVYKPSGAGGGDIGVAFGDDADALERLVHEAANEGFAALTIDIDPLGIETLER